MWLLSLLISFCYFLYFRQVYSSLSFVIPVIIFTLVYNIPKFFELTVVNNSQESLRNYTFAQCAQKVINVANSTSAPFDNDKSERIISNGTITKNLAKNESFLQEKTFIAVENIYSKVLEECCNCTKNNYYHNANNGLCDTATINDFISQLVEFYGSTTERNTTTSFAIKERVR